MHRAFLPDPSCASQPPASQPVLCDSMRRLPVTGFQITCQAPQQLFLSLPFLLLSLRVVGPQTPQMQCNRLTANMSGGPAHLHAGLGPNCQLHYTCEVMQKEFHESLGVLFPCCWQSSRLTSASAGPAGGGNHDYVEQQRFHACTRLAGNHSFKLPTLA